MEKLRIAVPTKAHAGLEDVVSEVFGKAKTFALVDVEDGEIEKVQVVDNPAASYEHGAGPVAVKTLIDLEVNIVLAAELGPGASSLLEQHNIRKISVKPNIKVSDCVKQNLSKTKAERA